MHIKEVSKELDPIKNSEERDEKTSKSIKAREKKPLLIVTKL